jgi:type IV pilus assembly protein PilM
MKFTKTIVGLHITHTSIQIIQVLKKGRNLYLSAFNKVLLPAGVIHDGVIIHPEMLTSIITEALKTANPQAIEAGSDVVVAIPEKVTFTHIFKYPKNIKLDEINKSIPFQAEQVIPYSKRDIYWDFYVLPHHDQKEKYYEVLYAAGQKTIIDTYYQVLRACDLNPILLCLESGGLIKALNHIIDLKKAVIILDVNYHNSNVYIIEEGEIKTTVSTVGAFQMFNEAAAELNLSLAEVITRHRENSLPPQIDAIFEKSYLKIVSRIKQIILYYQNNFGKYDLKTIYTNGQYHDLVKLDQYLQTTLGLEVKNCSPCNSLLKNSKLKFKDNQFESCQIPGNNIQPQYKCSYFTNAIGLAIRGFDSNYFFNGINLLPYQHKETFLQQKILNLAKSISAISIIFISSLMVFFALNWNHFKYEYEITESKNQNLRQVVEGKRYNEMKQAIDEFNQEVSILTSIEKDCLPVVPLLKKMNKLNSDSVFLTSIKYLHPEKKMEFTGVAKTREEVIAIQQEFESKEYVTAVESPISNLDKRKNPSFLMTVYFDSNKLACTSEIINQYFLAEELETDQQPSEISETPPATGGNDIPVPEIEEHDVPQAPDNSNQHLEIVKNN